VRAADVPEVPAALLETLPLDAVVQADPGSGEGGVEVPYGDVVRGGDAPGGEVPLAQVVPDEPLHPQQE